MIHCMVHGAMPPPRVSASTGFDLRQIRRVVCEQSGTNPATLCQLSRGPPAWVCMRPCRGADYVAARGYYHIVDMDEQAGGAPTWAEIPLSERCER